VLDTTLIAVAPPVHVVVVGDVMVDVVVRPLGPFNRGSDTPSEIVVTPGGSGANQAVALAAAGARVSLVGVVGYDDFGQAAASALAAAGIEARLAVSSDARTGMVVSLVGGSGQRSMLTDRGANITLGESSFSGDLFAAGRHLHLSGYELLDDATRPAGLTALALAAGCGMTRSVDPCSAGPLARVGAPAFLAWTHGVDLCCANFDEGRALSGAEDPEEIIGYLRHYYKEVALTLGADGALFSGDGYELIYAPAEPVEVTDTTGAGDAFTGTFLAMRLGGVPPDEALRAGLAASARVVTTPGARPWA